MKKTLFSAIILSLAIMSCKKDVSVTDISLNKTSETIYIGDTLLLTATVSPENATNKDVTWRSSDFAVAAVIDGKVIALSAGSTTITAMTKDGNKMKTCAITVNTPVDSVVLNTTSKTLGAGNTLTLTATVFPSNATDKTVIWTSSDTTIATVVDGKVTALSNGSVTITATTQQGGKTATCSFTIPISVKLTPRIATRVVGDFLVLNFTVFPAHAEQRISLVSSNTAVAIVDDIFALITPLAPGTANIIATTVDGATDTCFLTVEGSCNTNTPDWGSDFGTVGFVSSQTWKVGNQEWSDAVTATNCNKTSFASGSSGNFNADCRNNPDFPGDLFSWCAIVRFQDELCPGSWRVPSHEDFIALDIAMGGTGRSRTNNRDNIPFIKDNYLNPNVWGGHHGGWCTESGHVYAKGMTGSYWSITGPGTSMWFGDDIIVLHSSNHRPGATLRCVR
jgi:uncharacterized protein YjdB